MANIDESIRNLPELKTTRKLLLGCLVVNFINYAAVIISLTVSMDLWGPESSSLGYIPLYTIIPILVYYLIEGSLFFSGQAYSWPCTLTLRIFIILHDLGYCIFYCIFSFTYSKYKRGFCEENPDNWRCQNFFPYTMSACVFYLLTSGIGCWIIILYSKFPTRDCCRRTEPTVVIGGITYTAESLPNFNQSNVSNENVNSQSIDKHKNAIRPIDFETQSDNDNSLTSRL